MTTVVHRYSADESLILYLPLDEGQGSIVMDASSFKNEGEIVGDAAWVEGKHKLIGKGLYNFFKKYHFFT